MKTPLTAILLVMTLRCAFAAEPTVDQAVPHAEKKYPAGDYDQAASLKEGPGARLKRSVPSFEIHAVATSKGASKKMYSYDHLDGATETLYLEKRVLLDGRSIQSAQADHDAQGEFIVRLKLSAAGAEKLGKITTKLLNRRFAMLVEGRVVSAPVIRSVMSNGDLVITTTSENAAAELATKLNPPSKR